MPRSVVNLENSKRPGRERTFTFDARALLGHNAGMSGQVVQINISPGGVPKTGIASAAVEELGITGAKAYPEQNKGEVELH